MSSDSELRSILGESSLGFKPVHYDLDLDLSDHTKRNFVGHVKIQFARPTNDDQKPLGKNNSENLELLLNSEGLVIVSAILVSENQEKATVKYDRATQRIHLIFNDVKISQLGDTSKINVEIKYLGKITKINTYKDQTKGLFITNYLGPTSSEANKIILATQSQPCDSRTIFPCIDELSTKATFGLTLRLNPRFNAISSTPVESEELINDETARQIKFEKSSPMVISLFSFVCGDMEYIEKTVELPIETDHGKSISKEFPIRMYTLVGSLAKASYTLNLAAFFLPIVISKLKHSSYPGKKLDLVALPFLSNGAVENSNLIAVQQDIVLVSADEVAEIKRTGKCSNKIKQLNQIILHELVHQWFGNLVSFDNWNAYWLNESLASFLAYCVLNEVQFDADFSSQTPKENINTDYQTIWYEQSSLMESTFATDAAESSVAVSTIADSVQNINVGSIEQTFNQLSYEKGVHLLRMFMNVFNDGKYDDSSEKFFEVLGKLAEKYKYNIIKMVDFWLFFNEEFNGEDTHEKDKFNLTNFIMSWIKLPGLPMVDLSLTEEGLIKIEQHRFLEDEAESSTEDYIYHIPLSIVLKDGANKNMIFTERSKVFSKEELSIDDFVAINSNCYFKVFYQNLKFYETVSKSITALQRRHLVRFLMDTESFIGTAHQKSFQIEGLLKIVQSIVSEKKQAIPYEALEVVLRIMQFLGSSIQLFKSVSEYQSFKTKFMNKFVSKLFQQLSPWPTDFSSIRYTKPEITCRNLLLLIGVEVKEVNDYCQSLFRNLNHGPKDSVPRELVSAVLINYAYNTTNMKNFKKVLQLSTRSCEVMIPNIYNSESELEIPISTPELQSAAISSLGFVRDTTLLQKALNYVATNIDSRGIELGLVGFNYYDNNRNYKGAAPNQHKKIVFDWFKLQFYNGWGHRSLREGSDYSSQLYQTVHNIMEIIVKNFTSDEDKAVIRQFIRDIEKKDKLYQKHRFGDLLNETIESQSREKACVEKLDIERLFVL
ncbi:Tma108 protein [Saccharomycopsis crataegensis]|uniref:Aminopeptidase n=1 Tax=Saccharomycopsis crataegensis TaxID=43959 RepID=A0AAV5QK75_9ASCO|nr:Tma108 protein [Saccharomycopsis crataegensis]